MNFTKIITQFKRELWENKTGFIYTPVIVTSLFLLISISGVIYSLAASNVGEDYSGMQFRCTEDYCGFNSKSDAEVNNGDVNKVKSFDVVTSVMKDASAFNSMILAAMYGNCIFLSFIFSLVLATYVLRCLFDDRKNKEILFWRSMPVSETTNVLVKLGMQIVAAPLIMLLINTAVSCILIVAGLIIFTLYGVPFGYLISSLVQGGNYYVPLQIFFETVFGFIMLLPVIGYFLCASAFAKKSPFFTGMLIPVMLIICDIILNKLMGVTLGVVKMFNSYIQVLFKVKDAYLLGHPLILDASVLLPFVICVSIGSMFVAAAIWLRNNRYEI